MATAEARDFYYKKAKRDYLIGFYDQPFPSAMALELDEFEMTCNKAYKQGFADAEAHLRSKV